MQLADTCCSSFAQAIKCNTEHEWEYVIKLKSNIWSPRLQEHCEKHKDEYSSPTAYNNAIKLIPEIINNPDYIGLHQENGNLQYIKKLDDISLVGIKIIKGKGNLLFRTIFPITEDKLNYYLYNNRIIPYNKREK